jgi:hypothetical protein
LNGHVISQTSEYEIEQPFCHHCGAETITQCQSCKGPLRGEGQYVRTISDRPDAYCLHCGKPLPWTECRLDALREMAEYAESLDKQDQEVLADILPDLTAKRETPRTQLAIMKMKTLLVKGGPAFAESAKKILTDVVSEIAKKALFP